MSCRRVASEHAKVIIVFDLSQIPFLKISQSYSNESFAFALYKLEEF